jgi:pimeloyl-ACP methyl ester carboxylesterase
MNMHMNDSEYIKTGNNVYLHIRDWGEGKTIVFIPGWPFGHEMYEYQFTQLPQLGYRCIGISMRGFGRSSKPWGEYTYDIFADDLHSVLHSLNLTNVTLVGFSMGGAIAVRYMARHKGDRIASLVLCSAAVPSVTARPGFPFGIEPGTMDDRIKLCYTDRARLNADFGKQLFRESSLVTPQLLDWFQALGMEASAHATGVCLAALRDSDLREDIPSVKVPTILFHGQHDRICPFKLSEIMALPTEVMPSGEVAMAAGSEAIVAGAEPAVQGIRGARLISFENSGHALFYEEREKFNSELINFIERKTFTEEKYFGAATR